MNNNNNDNNNNNIFQETREKFTSTLDKGARH